MNILATVALAALLLRSEDYSKLRSVGSVQLSPDGSSAAYSVVHNDGEGRPYRKLWIAGLAGGKHTRSLTVSPTRISSTTPTSSPFESRTEAFGGCLRPNPPSSSRDGLPTESTSRSWERGAA